MIEALIFDCDGVLVDTERDGHRVAFNLAFAECGLDCSWDPATYGKLLSVAGGKERMRHYFDEAGWPPDCPDRETFIAELHRTKTMLFMDIIDSGQLPLRPGVERIVDEAISLGLTLAVCSTSNERAVTNIVERLLGIERRAAFREILAGDVVSAKKPDPEIYNLASARLGIGPRACLVVEDSRNGLLAANAAGMHCVVTISTYTGDETFDEAAAVYPELGDPPDAHVSLATILSEINSKPRNENEDIS